MYRLEMIKTATAMIAHGHFKTARAQLFKILEMSDPEKDLGVYAKTLTLLKMLLTHLHESEVLQEVALQWQTIENRVDETLLAECQTLAVDIQQYIKISHVTDEVKDHWNKRYENGYYYGKMANEFLISEIQSESLQGKKILCLAEGQGRNSVYLAEQGALVTSVDISRVGLEKGRALAEERGVADRMIWHEADLDVYDIQENSWDYIVAIFMHLPPKIRHKIFTRIEKGLVSKGKFIGTFYRPEQLSYQTGGPKDIALLVSPDDIYQAFSEVSSIACDAVVKEVIEGQGHTGEAAVLEVVIQK